MYLTEQQLNFFHTFGFIHIPQLFNPDEVVWITEEFEHVLDTYGKGDGHDGSQRTMIVPTIDHSEKLCTLLDDSRVVGIASDILGDDFNYASGDGNYYSGIPVGTPMADTLSFSRSKSHTILTRYAEIPAVCALCRAAIALTPSGGRRMWHRGILKSYGEFHLRGSGECRLRNESRRSGNLLPRYPPRLFRCSERRRMFTMNLIKQGVTEEGIARVDQYLRHHCPVAHGFKIGGMYTDLMLETASPERLRHLAQLHERHALVHPHDTLPRPLPRL